MNKHHQWYILFFLVFATFIFVSLYKFTDFFQNTEILSQEIFSENPLTPEQKTPLPLSDRDILLQNMTLTFSDEFDSLDLYTDLNGNTTCNPGGTGTWQTVYHFCSRTNPANLEAEVYTDHNFLSHLKKISKEEAFKDSEYPFATENSILKIKAQPASNLVTKNVGSWAKYTSGMITTQFSFSQTYGYFEIKAKLPKGNGIWPAFWLLPVDKTWPPEVDVFEAFGEKNSQGHGGRYKIYSASHSNKTGESCGDWHDFNVDLTEEFHTYGANIQADKITYYFDGKIHTTCKANSETNEPFYILINIAVGGPGSWPGEPGPNNEWPAVMEVDYVKAFQTKESH